MNHAAPTTPFPIGTPGVPWGDAERRAWRTAQPRRRIAPLMILFIVVFVIMALLAMGIGAWAMGMLPF